LYELLQKTPIAALSEINIDDRIRLGELENLIPVFYPYKGVLIINHDDRFDQDEINFAKERTFCLISYEDLLVFKRAVEERHMEAWFFLEEIWLTDGVMDLKSFCAFNLDRTYIGDHYRKR